MDATFSNTCTKELVVQAVTMITAAVILRFVLFGCSGVAAIKERMAHCSSTLHGGGTYGQSAFGGLK